MHVFDSTFGCLRETYYAHILMQAGVAYEQNEGTSFSLSCLPLTCCLRCQHEKHHAASRKKTWHCWLRRPLHRDEIQYWSHPPLTLSLFSLYHFLHHFSVYSSLHSFSQCITFHQTFNQNLSSFWSPSLSLFSLYLLSLEVLKDLASSNSLFIFCFQPQ